MSDAVRDRTVAIAEFHYRHDAEFAAGFLREADIPYRLQVDDASGLGLSIVRPSVLWVREMDAHRARDLIGADERSGESEREGPSSKRDGSASARGAPVRKRARGPGVTRRRGAEPARRRPPHDRGGRERAFTLLERGVSGIMGVTAFTTAGVLPELPYEPLWTGACLILGIGFAIGAAVGRAPGPFGTWVKALSGGEP